MENCLVQSNTKSNGLFLTVEFFLYSSIPKKFNNVLNNTATHDENKSNYLFFSVLVLEEFVLISKNDNYLNSSVSRYNIFKGYLNYNILACCLIKVRINTALELL